MTEADIALDTYGISDRGKVREVNEDQFLIASMSRAMAMRQCSLDTPDGGVYLGDPDATLLVVADGMGGASAGEVASSIAVRTIAKRLCNFTPFVVTEEEPSRGTVLNLRDDLKAALTAGESSILRSAEDFPAQKGMGTTLTAAYLVWPRLYIVHAGDSRCYLYRKGKVSQLTQDHTMAEKLVARGVEIEDASHLHHMLWNALGGKTGTPTDPEVHKADLLPRDAVLLCSDGLTKHVDSAQIAAVLNKGGSAQSRCEELVALANAGGGRDNITVVLAWCNQPAPSVA